MGAPSVADRWSGCAFCCARSMSSHTRVHPHMCVYIYTHIHIHTCIHICIHTYTYLCIYTHLNTPTCIHICVSTYNCPFETTNNLVDFGYTIVHRILSAWLVHWVPQSGCPDPHVPPDLCTYHSKLQVHCCRFDQTY